MDQTLGVLCEELSDTHREHRERMQRFEQRSKQFQRSLGRDSELCNKIELMLYSQKEQNVFDLAYACGQATELYNRLSRTRSFKQFEQQQEEQIAQYENLIEALNRIPERQLKTQEMRITRDSCIYLAKIIMSDIRQSRETLKESHEQRKWVANKAKSLNDYALKMYERRAGRSGRAGGLPALGGSRLHYRRVYRNRRRSIVPGPYNPRGRRGVRSRPGHRRGRVPGRKRGYR